MGSANGGIPHVVRTSFDTTGRPIKLPFPIQYLVVRNKSAFVGRIYFTEDSFTNGINYVEVPVASAILPYGEWRGPVETVPASEYNTLYLQGVGGSADLELVAFQRRA